MVKEIKKDCFSSIWKVKTRKWTEIRSNEWK